MIDRRAFLRRLGFGTVAAAAAAIGVFDVEKLLWLPNEKTIFIPAIVEVNEFAYADWLASECLKILQNNLKISGICNREYSDRYSVLNESFGAGYRF